MANTVNDEVGDEHNDHALQQEIDLLGDLMEAVTAAGHPLCQLEIDRVLSVESHPPNGRLWRLDQPALEASRT